jgi:hypothetical protein
MFLPIKDFTQLDQADLNIRQAFRINRTRKKYAVLNGDNLHLVDDLERLIFDTLRAEDLYNVEVYQLR